MRGDLPQGIFGYPLDAAIEIAVREVKAFVAAHPGFKVFFVVWDGDADGGKSTQAQRRTLECCMGGTGLLVGHAFDENELASDDRSGDDEATEATVVTGGDCEASPFGSSSSEYRSGFSSFIRTGDLV